jgi:hypothetical protein
MQNGQCKMRNVGLPNRSLASVAVAVLLILAAGDSAAKGALRGREIARYEEARTQAMLDRLLGPGRAKVVATVEMDHSRVEETTTTAGPSVTASRSGREWRSAFGSGSTERVVRRVSRSIKRTVSLGPRVRRKSVLVLLVDGKLCSEGLQELQ